MDTQSIVVAGCICIAVGFVIRFVAEATTWGKDMSSSQLKSRIFVGYGALILLGAIGVLLISYGAGMQPK